MAVKIEITSNARQVIASFRAMPAKMARGIAAAINRENNNTVTAVIEQRMNYSKQGPVIAGGLRRQSGMAVKSIRVVPAEITASGVSGSFGSNLRYLKAHEFGFQGTVNVRGHMRRVFKHGTKTKQVFDIPTQTLVERIVNTRRVVKVKGPGGRKRDLEHYVRPHSMRMNLPERRMFRDTLQLRIPNYSASISNAIVAAWDGKQGNLQAQSANDRGGLTP